MEARGFMIMRFTESNWERFFTHGKKTTFRIHCKRIGHYGVCGGSYYNPVKFGELDIVKVDAGKPFKELTEQDAKDDGFDSLEELKKEIQRLNKITDETTLYKHWIVNVKKAVDKEEDDHPN